MHSCLNFMLHVFLHACSLLDSFPCWHVILLGLFHAPHATLWPFPGCMSLMSISFLYSSCMILSASYFLNPVSSKLMAPSLASACPWGLRLEIWLSSARYKPCKRPVPWIVGPGAAGSCWFCFQQSSTPPSPDCRMRCTSSLDLFPLSLNFASYETHIAR